MRMHWRARLATVSFLFLLVGCGEAVPSGVRVVTDPPGAEVRLAGREIGHSPVLIPRELLKNHSLDTYTLVVSKEGYASQQLVVSQKGGILRVALRKKAK